MLKVNLLTSAALASLLPLFQPRFKMADKVKLLELGTIKGKKTEGFPADRHYVQTSQHFHTFRREPFCRKRLSKWIAPYYCLNSTCSVSQGDAMDSETKKCFCRFKGKSMSVTLLDSKRHLLLFFLVMICNYF